MQLLIPDKKPRIRQKVQAPDQRSITVCPIRAATDRNLTPMELRALLVLCSYTNKAGVTWAGLERIGQDLGVSRVRAGVLIRSLGDKGYVRVIHKGFKGYCADSRQVVFKADISADQAAAVAGELAPYQLQKQEREAQKMTAEKKIKRKPRKANAIEGINRTVNADSVSLSAEAGKGMQLVDLQVHTQYANVDAAIVDLAIEAAGPGATPAQIDAAIDRLLR